MTLAENGLIALDKFDREPFDVILMDMQMPEMGGADAIAAIRVREQATGAHIPIVSLTAHALKGDRERCLATGADGYVSKPISPAALFAEIERVVTGRAKTLPMAPAVYTAPALEVSETLLARVGGSHEMLEEIIGLFLEDSPKLIEEIRKALSDGDVNGAYRGRAHTQGIGRKLRRARSSGARSATGSARARGQFRSCEGRVRRARTGDDTTCAQGWPRRGRQSNAHPDCRRRPRHRQAPDGPARAWGYETDVAEDGETALQMIADQRTPYLALLDWMLPGMDGPEVCRLYSRKRLDHARLPHFADGKKRAGGSRGRTRRGRR